MTTENEPVFERFKIKKLTNVSEEILAKLNKKSINF